MFGEDVTIFKILSTTGVFLFGTVWAFQNIRAINEWIALKTGIGKSADTVTETVTESTDEQAQ